MRHQLVRASILVFSSKNQLTVLFIPPPVVHYISCFVFFFGGGLLFLGAPALKSLFGDLRSAKIEMCHYPAICNSRS